MTTPDLKNLAHAVLCKSTYPFFETIAAFDCEPAADIYMRACRSANPRYEYKVVAISH